jgi:hypothetical protein
VLAYAFSWEVGMKRILFFCIFFILFYSQTYALTGNNFLEYTEKGTANSQAFLTGYLGAIVDIYFLDIVCIPEGATNVQIIKVIEKYLNNHPELLHTKGPFFINKAIREAWSCKEFPAPWEKQK